MQIVIDIPENRYDEIHSLKFVMYGLKSEENRQLFYRLINAVQDGTVLPKGHGRLIDADEISKTYKSGNWDLHKVLDKALTVLEADKDI